MNLTVQETMTLAATALQRGCCGAQERKSATSADPLGVRDRTFQNSSTGWHRSRFPTADGTDS